MPSLFPNVQDLRLPELCGTDRYRTLATLDCYAQGTQYDGRPFDWDGRYLGYGEEADVKPGYYVPYKRRKPSTVYQLGKLINRRLTAMVFGAERWPEIRVDGDPEAEDYAKALARESNLHSKMLEARDRGGGCGTAVVSFKFLNGKPRVDVHDAKHIVPLGWADRDAFVLSAALKVHRGEQVVWENGKAKKRTLYHVRMWTMISETVWDPIPEEQAKNGTWFNGTPSYTVEHGYGECPVYWTQNLPSSEEIDGRSDFDGLTPIIDSINVLLSAAHKGTVANVDPTLVIKDDPGNNPGMVRKGEGTAIFSKNGAEYLELKGEAVRAAIEEVKALTRMVLDVAGVVLGDPEKISGSAQSAAAMKMLYLPMLNQCDQLRTQYGDGLLLRVLGGMLRAARLINASQPGEVQITGDGRLIQERPVVILPPRLDVESGTFTRGHNRPKPKLVERTPGTGDNITLSWPAYFKATAQDVAADVGAANQARGSLIADQTAVKYTAHHFGVTDTEAEQALINDERQQRALEMPGPEDEMFGGGTSSEG